MFSEVNDGLLMIRQLLDYSSIHSKKERFKLKNEIIRDLEGFLIDKLTFYNCFTEDAFGEEVPKS